MKIKTFFIFLFIFSASVFYAHARIVGSAVWGDGIYYYSYARGLVIHGGFTTAELAGNKYSFGTSLFWIIPFIFIHLFLQGTGNEFIYQIAAGLTSVGFGISGLFICFKILKKYFNTWISLISVLGLYFSSNLFFYTAVDPINSHAVSFFTSAILVYLSLKYFVISKSRTNPFIALSIGLVTGLLSLIRNQDIIFALPLFVLFFLQKRIHDMILYALGIIGMLIPQFALWYYIYGRLNSPYLMRGERFYLFSPHFLDALISSNNGLIYTTPILLFSLFGLLLYLVQKKPNDKIYITGAALFILQTVIIGSWQYWDGGKAYGGRMFISLMPFFLLGIAPVIAMLKRRIFQLVFLSFFALTNFINILSYLFLH